MLNKKVKIVKVFLPFSQDFLGKEGLVTDRDFCVQNFKFIYWVDIKGINFSVPFYEEEIEIIKE